MKTVVIFSSKTCVPCAQLKASLAGKVDPNKVRTVMVDDNPEEVQKYKIQSVPTVLFMKDGIVMSSEPGYTSMSIRQITAWLEE